MKAIIAAALLFCASALHAKDVSVSIGLGGGDPFYSGNAGPGVIPENVDDNDDNDGNYCDGSDEDCMQDVEASFLNPISSY